MTSHFQCESLDDYGDICNVTNGKILIIPGCERKKTLDTHTAERTEACGH